MGVVFVVFVNCPVLPARFGVPVLRVSVPVEVVAQYLPSSRRSRSRSAPSSTFLGWLDDALRSRGIVVKGWISVLPEAEARRRRGVLPPLPLVVLG